jgi:predicted nucleic acid-binding protein
VADWATISALATAAGTLVLAAATFVSVRSSNRSARATERALLAGIRPVLVPSRFEDPPEKVGFADDHWLRVAGGRGGAESTDDAVYLAIALRNVGNGLAVLDRWDFYPDRPAAGLPHRGPEAFRRLTRDLYVPAGNLGYWQGAFRDKDDPMFAAAAAAIAERRPMTVDLLYGDHEGGQRTITRFTLLPRDDGGWLTSVSRHWNLDRSDPR